MNLNTLERRLATLERPLLDGIDPLEKALEILNDTEQGILEEYFSLMSAGFSLEEVRKMMGEESYCACMAIIEKVDDEYKRLTVRPKRRAKPLQEHKDECVAEDCEA